MNIDGVWLPVITPFRNDEIDYISYKNLIDNYIQKGINGIIANGTTGESPVLSEHEFEELAYKTAEYVNNRIPVYYGVGGYNTKKLTEQINIIEKANVQGILSVSPFYNRPDQRGIFEHFKKLSESTTLPVILYNIPYRTGRNMENETILKLAELKNIVGIKDSCGNINQTIELLGSKPNGFSVFTGEDILFYTCLAHGANGGILASAHVQTEKFIQVYELMKENDHLTALHTWNMITPIIPLLFKEPNPAPLKYILHKQKLIKSGEIRLPLLEITESLKKQIDQLI
jgi:4-hydroxy-tetrahydrodipicolinate synthase